MDKTLPEVIADILIYNDSIVEHMEDGNLEVMAPSDVSEILDIPELTRLRFSYDESTDEAIYASYDSDFFNSIAKLVDNKGKLSVARYDNSSLPNATKLSKTISEKITFNNATFRLDKTEEKNISYLLCFFKYIALSDERQEGVMSILINEQNLSTVSFKHDITELNEAAEELQNIKRYEIKKVFQSAYSTCTCMVKEKLKDFINSLERRLNRDVRRVYEYYGTLKDETKKTIKKKAQAGSDNLIDKLIEEKTLKGDGVDKLLNKLDAIEAEREWKVKDLIAKYALNIRIEPVSAIRIETQSIISWISIKRRLASRPFPVCFNPITRQIDALPCESCFRPQKPYYTCDNKLHIICTNCYPVCNNCKKQYCKACYDMCPKCRKKRS